jgi:NAD(P)-dependent dehydrogenase (short-subunit alcohol dehydrogenase family)
MEYRASGNLRGLGGLRALVTGGGAGIGQAIADRLTVEDATVLIADRDVDAGQHAAQRLGARVRRRGPVHARGRTRNDDGRAA